MKVLIIHDRPGTAAEIDDIVRECTITVDKAADLLTARDALKSTLYDLVIIDLTLPVVINRADATHANASLLLQEIFEGGDIDPPGDIIGITVDIDALDVIKNDIGEHLLFCIKEDPEDKWKNILRAKLRYLGRVRQSRLRALTRGYDVDLLVMAALDKESMPFRTIFELTPVPHVLGAHSFSFNCHNGIPRRGVLFSVGTSGQGAMASATQAMIAYFRPRLALLSGFCGGVEGKVGFGDLLAFKSSYAWDYGKWVEVKDADGKLETVFRSRPTPLNAKERGVRETVRTMLAGGFKPSMSVIGAVTQASGGRISAWDMFPTAAASGSAVVTSGVIIDQIRDLDDGIWGIDMESYAFYYACLNTPAALPDFLCVKSVADYCNGTKNDDLHESCCLISASFIHSVVTGFYDFS